jgi:nucleoside-diphosphate-sugar epimerase
VPVPRIHIPVLPFYSLGSLCESICGPLGIDPPLYPRRVDFFVKNRAFDISKAQEELGYMPRVDLATGVARTAAWYRAQGYL